MSDIIRFESQYLNAVPIRLENIEGNHDFIMMRLLIKQLVLMNIIKNKFLVVKKLLLYFNVYITSNFQNGLVQPEFLKRTMYLMVLKNLAKNDDLSMESSLMHTFNEGFAELIKIVTMVRQLSFSKKLMIQVLLDWPDLLSGNENFRSVVDTAMVENREEMLNELNLQRQIGLELLPRDFVFKFDDRTYDVFIDKHAKHKIFCESIEQVMQKSALMEMKSLLLPFLENLERMDQAQSQ